MAITERDVEHIARLARLRITPEEKKLYQEQLEKILEHMAELKSLDTTDIPPTAGVSGSANVFRADKPQPFPDMDKLLSAAPDREGPCFKVPKVIE